MRKNNLARSFLSPFRRTNIIVMLLMVLALLYFNIYAGSVATVVFVILIINSRRVESANSEHLIKYIENITSEMDETIASSVIYNPLPLCMINSQGVLIWFNHKFSELFKAASAMNSEITQLTGIKNTAVFFPESTDELQEDDAYEREKSMQVNVDGKTFKVMATTIREDSVQKTAMLHWVDVSPYENLKTLYRNEKACFAYINVDNYDELVSNIPEDKKASVVAAIETRIRQWGIRTNSSLVRYSPSQYYMIVENEHLEKMQRNKFSILDEIREIETFGDFPASLTIGIGGDGKTPAQSQEYAKSALELGLGRGGDQVVVKKIAAIEYYGGKLQTVEKRNKGKSRILAHALRQMIDQSDKVIIMGHTIPDMDALGAAMGIARLAKMRDKDDYIVIENVSAIDLLYREAVKSDKYNFISKDVAIDITDKDTLLVVVDTHKPSLVECAALFKLTDKIAVIDHHRRGEEIITAPTLTYIEPYASSASELVAELLEYSSDKKELTKLEAEALLAGMTVDTKNFSVKTGVRTFQAAAWLRRQGADTSIVRSFFQTNMELFKQKAAIISNARIVVEGVAMSHCEGKKKNIAVLISMAADEILNIRGIKASIVLGEAEDGSVRVSARSLGEINVQMLMEKIGGGGHFTTAGAQMEIPLADAIKVVEDVIKNEIDGGKK